MEMTIKIISTKNQSVELPSPSPITIYQLKFSQPPIINTCFDTKYGFPLHLLKNCPHPAETPSKHCQQHYHLLLRSHRRGEKLTHCLPPRPLQNAIHKKRSQIRPQPQLPQPPTHRQPPRLLNLTSRPLLPRPAPPPRSPRHIRHPWNLDLAHKFPHQYPSLQIRWKIHFRYRCLDRLDFGQKRRHSSGYLSPHQPTFRQRFPISL